MDGSPGFSGVPPGLAVFCPLGPGTEVPYLFSVAQTSKSAVSRVSKPAGRNAAEPTWKSAIQQVWKPALHKLGKSALNRYEVPGYCRMSLRDEAAPHFYLVHPSAVLR